MASPQLQQIIDTIKALISKAGSIAEMRALNEQMARPAESDIKCEPLLANGVKAEWITRRALPPIASCSTYMAAAM